MYYCSIGKKGQLEPDVKVETLCHLDMDHFKVTFLTASFRRSHIYQFYLFILFSFYISIWQFQVSKV